jgi:hypothetical protein
MSLSTDKWNRIERFIGYGRQDAPVVFVGIEEGLSKESALETDLLRRAEFDSIMDLRVAHRGIAGADRFLDIGNPACQRTWRPMCDLMLRRRDASSTPTLKMRSQYQAAELGAVDGDTLLTELLPYPHRKTGDWLYKELRPHKTRKEYEASVLPIRLEVLSEAMRQWPRELIVCYGKANWPRFRCLIQKAFRVELVQWVPHRKPSCESAMIDGARVVLACHLSSKEFNSEQQLADLAAVALR